MTAPRYGWVIGGRLVAHPLAFDSHELRDALENDRLTFVRLGPEMTQLCPIRGSTIPEHFPDGFKIPNAVQRRFRDLVRMLYAPPLPPQLAATILR